MRLHCWLSTRERFPATWGKEVCVGVGRPAAAGAGATGLGVGTIGANAAKGRCFSWSGPGGRLLYLGGVQM